MQPEIRTTIYHYIYMNFGTPLTSVATKALLLGSGELGKEVALELQRYGVEVIACDKYANAPAMQVAHRCHVLTCWTAQNSAK